MKPILQGGFPCVVMMLLVGCELLQPRPTAMPEAENKAPEAQQQAEVPKAEKPQTVQAGNDTRLQAHMQFIDLLNRSSTRQLDGIYDRVVEAFEQTPNTENRLRLAWVYATPGHGHSNLWAARMHLQEASHDSRLSQDMARFVRLRLKDIRRNLHMASELSEANKKIRALTSLEHSMEERDAEVQEE